VVRSPETYFEAGGHVARVHLSGSDFLELMADTPPGPITWHV